MTHKVYSLFCFISRIFLNFLALKSSPYLQLYKINQESNPSSIIAPTLLTWPQRRCRCYYGLAFRIMYSFHFTDSMCDLLVIRNLIPCSHQSLNMFKSCFNKLVLLNCPFTSRARLTKHV